jgi:DnaJ-class molecular chaperone
MSSQLQDYFEEAVETVARLLYARNRTPREPAWTDTDKEIRDAAIRDARTVIDLWIKVSSPCLWCHGTGRTADGYPCRVCGGVGFRRLDADEPEPFFTEQQEAGLLHLKLDEVEQHDT